jgi:hypothetical protein
LVQRRTAMINEMRGFPLQRGITFLAQPIHNALKTPQVIEDAEQNLSRRLRLAAGPRWQECKQRETDIKTVTDGPSYHTVHQTLKVGETCARSLSGKRSNLHAWARKYDHCGVTLMILIGYSLSFLLAEDPCLPVCRSSTTASIGK